MVDYPYVECTSACVQALSRFQQFYGSHRKAEIRYAHNIKREEKRREEKSEERGVKYMSVY
jgi:hypothetical protein